jgi:two-component sensor histidine kinase
MSPENLIPEQDKLTLKFKDNDLEREFKASYDNSVRNPLRYGIIISLLSWFSAIGLIYAIIPEKSWLALVTVLVIGSFFGFIIYTTFRKGFKGYYHFLGACSNAWAGVFTIYFCDQFPNGENLILPVLIFIIFFGSYMIRLKWIAGFLAALIYIVTYHVYIVKFSGLPGAQVMLYTFVGWMTFIFAILAGRVAEANHRIAYTQRETIRKQSEIIEQEKIVLLKEVHHRVKNNLQIIVSLINLQRSKFDNPAIDVALKETQSRVFSMSLVHQRMHQTSSLTDISLAGYMHQLIQNIQGMYPNEGDTFTLDFDEKILVDIETAVPLGLIVNEIVTNFYKHCKTEGDLKKSFAINLENISENKYFLKYSDNGQGFQRGTTLEGSNTLGLELIDSLSYQIDAEFKFFNDNGAKYEFLMEL